MTAQSKALVSLEEKAKQLDKVAGKFSNAMSVADSPFSTAITLSQGIAALRELLDDGIMGEVMRLADSPLGFMTDRAKSGAPYKISEVKDAIIEASLRGFRVAGNEFNIISGRFYGAKAGLHRKVISYSGVTDFKETFGIPKMAADKGAIVVAKANWKQNGHRAELTREFAIRVNAGMGVDAIIGKCQRKLYAAVLNQLSGIITPDGEIEQNGAETLPVRTFTPDDVSKSTMFGQQAPQTATSEPELPRLVTEEPEIKEMAKLDQLKERMVKDEVTTAEILRVCENNHAKVNSLEEITDYYLSNLIEWWDDVMIQVTAFRKEVAK